MHHGWQVGGAAARGGRAPGDGHALAVRDGPRLVYDTGGHNIQKTQADELADALAEWIGGLRKS